MLSFFRAAATIAVVLGLSSGGHAIGKVTRSGRYLYNADGSRFYIKGIAYQEQGKSSSANVGKESGRATIQLGAATVDPNAPFSEPSTFIDPLANATACARDIPLLQQLGVNSIRVYSVNASLNHDSCMQGLSSAGIYTILDLTLPVNGSIDRSSPAWTTNLLDSYINTIDAFSKYDNVLAYNVGNEVVVSPNGTTAATFVKAAARDTKAYLTSKSSSALVGYAAIDGDDTWIVPLANYLSCDPSGGNSGGTAIDIFGLNNYEFCGDSTFQASYAGKTGDFAGYNVVAYFSEYGCNQPSPRVWAEVPVLFGSDAVPVWSGGVAFSYFPAESGQGEFGMVTLSSDGSTVTPNTDFDNLKTMYNQVSFINDPGQSSAPSASYPACPQQNTSFLASTALPPTPSDSACQCLESNLSCQFNPQTSNTSAIVGSLLDTACSLLGTVGGSCDPIAGNGQTGQYGTVSSCDPSTKLSFAMSEYFEANKRDPQACSFSGNGTVNAKASSSSNATVVASSCLASATGTHVPTAPSSATNPGSSSSGSSSSSSTPGAATTILVSDTRALLGVFLMFAVSVAGGLLSLA
ncbi:carbohydrate-binding module family 43 protein/Glycoside hydrolase family 72 protein [Lactarius akahatsu]|uniref:1,3-beta-glucanosyltransferase n=1 Tax=Lactarius akahatsu TaxID=416441 RepID=A0AAD4LHJ6_9AGAM|nr:carbohydrate-binding module family 43 protein/Glycoside hydrolase family 72 protein [Lactarius akahatsu]